MISYIIIANVTFLVRVVIRVVFLFFFKVLLSLCVGLLFSRIGVVMVVMMVLVVLWVQVFFGFIVLAIVDHLFFLGDLIIRD